MGESRGGYPDAEDATEAAGLLGADARQEEEPGEILRRRRSMPRKIAADGLAEFEGLPWHKRPSVCASAAI